MAGELTGQLVTLGGTIFTATAGVIVAFRLHSSEKGQSAESALEKTLRAEATLHKEEAAYERRRREEVEEELELVKTERDRYKAAIDQQRAEERQRTNGHPRPDHS